MHDPRDEIDETVCGLIEAFTAVFPRSEFGPGHISLSDYNLSDSSLDFCLAQPARKVRTYDAGEDVEGEDEAVRHFLRMLKAIPAHRRGEF